MELKRTIEQSDTPAGKVFDWTIQGLILASLTSFALETLPDIGDQFKYILYLFELFTVGIFTLEYLLRLWVADRKFKFIFSFFGLVDLLAILPFF